MPCTQDQRDAQHAFATDEADFYRRPVACLDEKRDGAVDGEVHVRNFLAGYHDLGARP